MTNDPTLQNHPAPARLTHVELHLLQPVSILLTVEQGRDAEQRANDFLHELSLLVPPDGTTIPVEVICVIEDDVWVRAIHRVRFLDPEHTVRYKVRNQLASFLMSERLRPPDLAPERIRQLIDRLSPPRDERCGYERLWNKARDVVPLHHENLDRVAGYMEFYAALVDALRSGAWSRDAIERARLEALELAPTGPGLWDYAAGLWHGVEDALDALAAPPPDERRDAA